MKLSVMDIRNCEAERVAKLTLSLRTVCPGYPFIPHQKNSKS